MDDQFLIHTLIIMAGIESKQPGAMPFEDNPLFVAAERLKQLTGTASNEVLARRVVELTNERDAALAQLVEVQDNRTGKAPCERFCEALATKKMFDNLQSDNRQLKAQVEQLRKENKGLLGANSKLCQTKDQQGYINALEAALDCLQFAVLLELEDCDKPNLKAVLLDSMRIRDNLGEDANQLRQAVKE